MTNTRPPRRTTMDPSFCFNDFSEFLTFIATPSTARLSIRDGNRFNQRCIPAVRFVASRPAPDRPVVDPRVAAGARIVFSRRHQLEDDE
jgi:hypothetical protein